VTVDYLMDNVWIVGDPSEYADQIHRESLRLSVERVAPRVGHLT
jgi:hypothetical protein